MKRAIVRSVVLVILVTSLLQMVPVKVAAMGVGIGPSIMEIPDTLRGGVYERVMNIFNSDAESCEFALGAEGETGSWVSFYNYDDPEVLIDRVLVPGQDKTPVLVKFTVPEDAPNKTYICNLYAESIPPTGEETTEVRNVVRIRAPAVVTIIVTGVQKVAGRVARITARDTEVGLPLQIEVNFTNIGNVVAKPKVEVTITKNDKLVDRLMHAGTNVGVDRHQIISLAWDTTGQREGDFITQVKVLLEDEVLEEQEISFKLLPVGALVCEGDLMSLECPGGPV
ncbi:MAG: hypothetical protein ABIB93_06780, partial [Chloroflexota bacterium]